ncbi:YgcG family protein, partial [Lutibacter sp.]|uniref:TPM domain-containing protein n=1 Tax=Lutibacter sp. TaxID=1925666 RepID=UPI003568E261
MKFLKDRSNFLNILLLFLLITSNVFSQNIPNKPSFIPALIDSTNTLTASEKSALETKLIRYSDSTSTELFLIIMPSTFGENINLYATELGHKWEIGQKGKDNGVVILLAKDDRKIAIQTGYGVEHLLTDALSKRIIENIILPEFKKGDYYAGLDKGTDVIIDILRGEYKGEPNKGNSKGGFPILLIIVIIFFLIIIFSKKNRGGGNNRGNRKDNAVDILTAILLSGAGRSSSGGFGGGSSSGGFGGFGGGGGFGG